MVRLFMLNFLLISSVFDLYAITTVNLSGRVSGGEGQPVAGAVVKIIGQNLKGTTNSNGEYSITSGSAVKTSFFSSASEQITFSGGVISFSLLKSTAVNIDIFDMKGKILKRVLNHTVAAGMYRYIVFFDYLPTCMMLIRVSCEKTVAVFRYIPLKGNISAVTSIGANHNMVTSGPVKLMVTIDSIRITASGFQTKVVAISSYEAEDVNVNLDPVAASGLDKFSFFVTSLEAMQDLSGSPDGFGGDFRFGKTRGSTEKGAGLLGADSICSCIAERSMPGSSVKKWRAFLSAMEGPDGNQVNAIDRIGGGPWYDRLERIVSNNIQELLEDRPAGAHSAIMNDLPNENGIPNHRPDPNGDPVDNHLTITGSNDRGELYGADKDGSGFMAPGVVSSTSENATCNDWTSTTVKSRPRSGMSWPQAMSFGMKNWISVWDQSGCEPGIDLEFTTGAGEPGVYTIGNGGGYGGFYCFALEP